MTLENQLKPLTEPESIACLNALLVGYEYLECLDAIAQTTLYKHSIKQKVNHLHDDLKKNIDTLCDLWDVDEEALQNIMEHKKQLMKKIALIRPENKSGLNLVLEEFFKAPELTIHRLGIKMINRDK